MKLEGLKVLVTRPAHQADKLCRLLEARGAKPVRLPLLSIEPSPHAATISRLLQQDYEGWIFTSANAVRLTQQLWRGDWCERLYAVGAATAAALEAGGRTAQAPVAAHSGSALLALPELQTVSGQRWLLLTGEGGLEEIAPALRARGASIETAELYVRVPIPYSADTLTAQLRGVETVLVTSGEALAHLWALAPEPLRAGLVKKILILPSARVREQAEALGFARCHAPARMSDEDLLTLLESLP